MFQRNVNSKQFPAVFNVSKEHGKKANDLLKQEFSQLQVSDMMSLIFLFFCFSGIVFPVI